MSPLKRSNNIAARMGRWSARHRKIAIFGWLAFVAVAFVVGTFFVGTKNIDPEQSGPGESGRMSKILDDSFKQNDAETVLVQSKSMTTDDPQFAAAVKEAVRTVSTSKDVGDVRSPFDPENSGQISRDGHSALVQFEIMTPELTVAQEKVKPIVADIEKIQQAHPELYVGVVGGATLENGLTPVFKEDLKKAGLFSVPVTLVILVLAFGALVAAGIPLLLALTAVVATMGLLALPSQLMPVDSEIAAVILLIGLAVGVDYSLFYVKREREERAAGRSEAAALEAAAATSGRSVLVSGLTVMVAMAGMFFTGDPTFSSFAVGTIMVVGIAVLGSLTVLPALLSKLGDKVDRAHVPFVGRFRPKDGEGRIWGAILDRVLKRPILSAAVSGGALLALAAPALHLHTSTPGPETYPTNIPVMKTFNRVQDAFPGEQLGATVVVKAADVGTPQVQEAIGQLKWRALASEQMHEPMNVDVSKDGTVAVVTIPIDGEGTDEVSNAALATLRNDIVPATVGALPGAEAGVTGGTAESVDWNNQMKSAAPYVFAFVLAFAFILLLAAFRSIVIAVKAIVLNLLSVAAAYGVLVLVFQHGWGKGLLGFEYTGGVVAFLPIFLFVILFGLSMDYHVFILSRVREAYDGGMTTEEAVAHGIKTTAGVVTSAAIVMVAVFSIFGTLSLLFLKQFGVGLAAAVLIDATIVRAVLLPATMKLLGDWNWYLPKWLEWLPHLERSERPDEAPDEVPAPVPAT
jgi:uncharacterized membrane protein YdfJ with MMPL/SSD domain